MATHFAGGINLSDGEMNLKFEENTETRNMKYEKNGLCSTSEGFGDPGWDFSENNEGIDGLFASSNYQSLIFAAVNGKIKYVNASNTPQASQTPYNVDTGLSLTKDNNVLFKEYRGTIYYCNGVENLGRIAVGQLASSVLAGAGTWALNTTEGYKFTNGADKVYCEGDEADYTAVSTDSLTTVTNGLAHSAGAYVTEARTITLPGSGSVKATTMAFFKETMWIAGMPDEPNVLRYSKTVAAVADIVSGYIHDFSDGNNYLIGEGGQITALLATRDRLYVFLKDRIYYIGISTDSTGSEVFSTEFLFSGIYGTPNAFCCAEMEQVVVVFTGKRVIRIGYDPGTTQILPDETFDVDIQPILRNCDTDQSGAEVFYNEDSKELRVKIKSGGVFKTAVYNNITKNWSYPSDTNSSRYVKHDRNTYFGSTVDDVVYRMGLTFDADDTSLIRRYISGRQDGGSRNPKLFIRGKIEGVKRRGNTLYLTTYIDNQAFGGPRKIDDTQLQASIPGNPLGSSVLGEGAIGTNGTTEERQQFTYPFLIGRRGKDIRLIFTSNEIGSDWGINKGEIEYEEYIIDSAKHY